jgi:hypothetical protein
VPRRNAALACANETPGKLPNQQPDTLGVHRPIARKREEVLGT